MGRNRVKEINFYDRYNEDLEKDKARRKTLVFFAPAAALLLIVLLTFTVLKIQGAIKNKQIEDIQDYIYSPSVSLEYANALKLKGQRDEANSEFSSIEGIRSNIKSYPAMNEEVLQQVQACLVGASMQSCEYNASQGAMYLTITAKSARLIPPIIRLLKSSGKFSTVAYRGYELEGQEGYGASIGCKLFAPNPESSEDTKEQNNEQTQ